MKYKEVRTVSAFLQLGEILTMLVTVVAGRSRSSDGGVYSLD